MSLFDFAEEQELAASPVPTLRVLYSPDLQVDINGVLVPTRVRRAIYNRAMFDLLGLSVNDVHTRISSGEFFKCVHPLLGSPRLRRRVSFRAPRRRPLLRPFSPPLFPPRS